MGLARLDDRVAFADRTWVRRRRTMSLKADPTTTRDRARMARQIRATRATCLLCEPRLWPRSTIDAPHRRHRSRGARRMSHSSTRAARGRPYAARGAYAGPARVIESREVWSSQRPARSARVQTLIRSATKSGGHTVICRAGVPLSTCSLIARRTSRHACRCRPHLRLPT